MFHRHWRQQALASLDQPFDLVVIGGGITGCGIFLDAAQRGLRVLLLEKGDLASGTSSRSSKLLHGGLRYLKNLQLGVTRKSCLERDRQLALNPNLVTPIPWLYPTYHGQKTPGWKVGLGLWVYDRLTQNAVHHRTVDEAEIRRLAPGLTLDDLDRAMVYQDARVDDARLTRAVAATGFAYGGQILTYASAEDVRRGARDELRAVVIRDQLDGATYEVQTPLLVNATGAWVDGVRHRLGLEGNRVRPSRGSHLIFERDRLPIQSAVTIESPDDRRPVFLIPHPEGTLVGTTDLFHHGPIDDPRPTREEVDYLLRVLAVGFPDRPPGLGDIRGAFAGVRPILSSDAETPSAASREEAVWFERGLLSVAGGKLTTWRPTAEETVDKALRRLPEACRRKAAPCATAGTPLIGLAPADLDRRLGQAFPLTPDVASAMARRLGSAAWTTLENAEEHELRPLRDDVDLCLAELRTHLQNGAVTHLSDLLLRRIRLGMWRPDQAQSLAPCLEAPIRELTGWSADRWDQESERFETEVQAWTLKGVTPKTSEEQP